MAVDGFLRRWAARKAESGRTRDRLRKETAREEAVPGKAKPPADGRDPDAAAQRRFPTMEDVRHLTQDSDYSLFVARETEPAVRRAALKTLFSDPHFNTMDGLDIYIEDYNRYQPLTPAMLAALQHARGMLAADGRDSEEASGAASEAASSPQEAGERQPAGGAADAPESGAP